MAVGAVRELVTKLKFVVDGSGLEAAKKKVQDFKDRMNRVSNKKIKIDIDTSTLDAAKEKLSSLGSKFALGGAALAGAGAGILGALMFPVKAGMEFEAIMSKVEAITGATGDEMKELVHEAKRLGATTIFSASEAGQAMTYLGMAGWDNEQIKTAMPYLLDLATATGDLARTADIVSDDLTAFGMKAYEAGRMADVMAAASMNANTNVDLMGYTFKYVGAVCGALGYTIEDAALATGLLANAGIKGEMAGTQLRAVLTRLVSPTKESGSAMDALGISVANADGSMKPLRQVLDELRKSFAGLTKEQQAQFAEMMAGKEAMPGLLSIVNATAEDFDKLAKAIDNSTGASKRFADVSKNNLKGRLKDLEAKMEALSITLYKKLAPVFSAIVERLSEFVDKINKFTKENPRLIAGIMAIAGAIGALFVALGSAGIFIGGLMNVGAMLLPVLAPILTALGGIGAVAAGPVALGFAAVAAMIAFVADNWELFYHWIEPGLGMIYEGVQLLAAAFGEVFTALMPILPPLWEIVKIIGGILVATLSVLFDVIAWVFKAWAENIKNIANLFTWLQGPIQTVADLLSGLVDKAKTFLGLSRDFGTIDASMRDAEHGGGGSSYSSHQEFNVTVPSTQDAVDYTNGVSDDGMNWAGGPAVG